MIDVAVIGAGPAGAWAGYLLARGGARVALFDPSHPREKPCGGGVTGRALTLIDDCGIRAALSAVSIRSAAFLDPATGTRSVVGLGDQALVVASRREFDGQLLAAARSAGASLIGARVHDVERDRDGWRISTVDGRAHGARFVIGADGATSLVRRRVAQPFSRAQLSIATGFFAHGASADHILIEFTADPPGYIWSFPRPDHLAIGICAQADARIGAAALRDRTAAWIGAAGIARGARLEPYSWPIPSLPAADLDRLELAGPRWMLIGDAAGFVDPITREGIFFALQSAGFAAAAVLSSTPDRSAAAYAEQARAEIVSELARAARFKARFFRPGFAPLMVRALRERPGIARVMADLVAGLQPYEGLKWRLAKTLEAGLAWQALRLVVQSGPKE